VLASLEVAGTRRDRSRGLLGRDGIDGAILLRPCRSVHTIGMRFGLDVAYCDGEMRVLRVVHMPRWRVGMPVPRARCAIEAEAGTFARWNLRPGDQLEIKGDGEADDLGARRP
jgi:uncharacterized membrane protein (UPF0127 family)